MKAILLLLTACVLVSLCSSGKSSKSSKLWKRLFCPPLPSPGLTCTGKVIDLVVVMDESGSIGKANFQKMKDFVKKVVIGIGVSKTGNHVGLVKFSTNATVEFHLKQYYTTGAVVAHVMNLHYSGGLTYTNKGLDAARVMFSGYGRSGVVRIALVLTDGRATDGPAALAAAAKLKATGVRIITVGIGNKLDVAELGAMASSSEDSLVAGDFDKLVASVKNITAKICQTNVRLIGGQTKFHGILQVFYKGKWYRVCGRYWTKGSARVVCRQLGYSGGRTSLTGVVPLHIPMVGGISCRGTESHVGQCKWYQMCRRRYICCKTLICKCKPKCPCWRKRHCWCRKKCCRCRWVNLPYKKIKYCRKRVCKCKSKCPCWRKRHCGCRKKCCRCRWLKRPCRKIKYCRRRMCKCKSKCPCWRKRHCGCRKKCCRCRWLKRPCRKICRRRICKCKSKCPCWRKRHCGCRKKCCRCRWVKRPCWKIKYCRRRMCKCKSKCPCWNKRHCGCRKKCCRCWWVWRYCWKTIPCRSVVVYCGPGKDDVCARPLPLSTP